jgi:DNA repair exonuclease SbcCD ATPase subunit
MSVQPGTGKPAMQQAVQPERIVVVCPSCQATLSVRSFYLGHQIVCKQCNQPFLLSAPAEPQTKSAASDHNGGISNSSLGRLDTEGESRATESDYDRLRSEHDRQAAGHAHYRLKYIQVGEDLSRVTADLNRIRAHLGTVAPEDVRNLVEERESLRAEVNLLSDANQVLRSEISAYKHLATEFERRESDLATLRDDCHLLGQQLKQRDDELQVICLEQESLIQQIKQSQDELHGIRTERDQLCQQLKQRDDDLAAARAEHGLLSIQLRDALNEVDQSRTLVERAQAVQDENDNLHAAVDSLRQALTLSEREHLDDLHRLKEQLDHAHEKDHDLVVLRAQIDQLRAEVDTVLARVEDLRRRLDVAELRRIGLKYEQTCP